MRLDFKHDKQRYKNKPLTVAHKPRTVWPCPFRQPVPSFFPLPFLSGHNSFLSVLSALHASCGHKVFAHAVLSDPPETLFFSLLAHLSSFQPFKYQFKKFPYFIDFPDWARFSHSQALEYHESPLSTYSKGSFPFI